jgi:hypothetical protein
MIKDRIDKFLTFHPEGEEVEMEPVVVQEQVFETAQVEKREIVISGRPVVVERIGKTYLEFPAAKQGGNAHLSVLGFFAEECKELMGKTVEIIVREV